MLQRLASLKQRTNIQRFYRAVEQVEANGDVTEEAEQYILQLQRTLAVPPEIAQPKLRWLAYLKQLTNIRNGQLPTISTNLQLESDELCHLETPATYHKVNAKSTTLVSGRLVATSKRLHFLSATRGTGKDQAPRTIYYEMWSQIKKARYRLLVTETIDFYVEAGEGHDDFLISLALLTVAIERMIQPAASSVIRLKKMYEGKRRF